MRLKQQDKSILNLYTGGLAWDWVNQKLYWTDYCDDDIEIYDPSTGVRRVLFDVGLTEPYAIVVDPTTGYALHINPLWTIHTVCLQMDVLD